VDSEANTKGFEEFILKGESAISQKSMQNKEVPEEFSSFKFD
jgi:hypothetical protein